MIVDVLVDFRGDVHLLISSLPVNSIAQVIKICRNHIYEFGKNSLHKYFVISIHLLYRIMILFFIFLELEQYRSRLDRFWVYYWLNTSVHLELTNDETN